MSALSDFINWDAFEFGFYVATLSFAVGAGFGWVAKLINRS